MPQYDRYYHDLYTLPYSYDFPLYVLILVYFLFLLCTNSGVKWASNINNKAQVQIQYLACWPQLVDRYYIFFCVKLIKTLMSFLPEYFPHQDQASYAMAMTVLTFQSMQD